MFSAMERMRCVECSGLLVPQCGIVKHIVKHQTCCIDLEQTDLSCLDLASGMNSKWSDMAYNPDGSTDYRIADPHN